MHDAPLNNSLSFVAYKYSAFMITHVQVFGVHLYIPSFEDK